MMNPLTSNLKDVDSYVAVFPIGTQKHLTQLRGLVQKIVPKAEESLSYQMPAYKYLGKPLVYFAGYKGHIGFYPTPSAILEFKRELSMYPTSKGAVQFPIDKALPVTLITQIVKFRKLENEEKAAKKSSK